MFIVVRNVNVRQYAEHVQDMCAACMVKLRYSSDRQYSVTGSCCATPSFAPEQLKTSNPLLKYTASICNHSSGEACRV